MTNCCRISIDAGDLPDSGAGSCYVVDVVTTSAYDSEHERVEIVIGRDGVTFDFHVAASPDADSAVTGTASFEWQELYDYIVRERLAKHE